jgi:hypothetical protein
VGFFLVKEGGGDFENHIEVPPPRKFSRRVSGEAIPEGRNMNEGALAKTSACGYFSF